MPGDEPNGVCASAARRRPVKARAIVLNAAGDVATAFAALTLNCSEHMLANEAGLLSRRNPEFLHQFRVGLRRLRSAFRVFRPLIAADRYTLLTTEMHWLAHVLGGARDWDVFMIETIKPLLRHEPAATGGVALQRRCVAQRRHCAQAVRAALASPRYAVFKSALDSYLDAPLWMDDDVARQLLAMPVARFAAQQIDKREKSVQRLAGALEDADIEHRHRLRIAAKKLRYSVEFFRSLFEKKPARRYAATLAEIQDALGKLNDCATARRLLGTIPAGRDAGSHEQACTLVTEWTAIVEQHSLAALGVACTRWRALPAFW